jgi:hypothetical protein
VRGLLRIALHAEGQRIAGLGTGASCYDCGLTTGSLTMVLQELKNPRVDGVPGSSKKGSKASAAAASKKGRGSMTLQVRQQKMAECPIATRQPPKKVRALDAKLPEAAGCLMILWPQRMQDLIDAGIIIPGRNKISVVYKGITYTASLNKDGMIIYQGNACIQ